MELYIMRHGDAVDREIGGYATDDERPLTDDGRSEVQTVAALLRRASVALDLLLTSPLLRARQTAELIADELDLARGPIVLPALAPAGDPADILAAAQGRRVMVVGHMPSLAELAGWLAWGDRSILVPLRTAGVCRIDLTSPEDLGEGDLRWLITPGLARRLSH